MNEKKAINTIIIESDSTPGEYYSVNTKSLICSCPHFLKKLHGLPIEDPHRLCKHLVKALMVNGIPEHLKQHKEDIEWFAKHNSAFTSKEKALKNKKWDINLPLPDGGIVTVNSSKKKKYCYIEGIGDEKKILATLPLVGGTVSYTISSFYGSYDLNTQASRIPWNYRYMEQAVINWIVDEYNKVKNNDAPIAKKKIVEYKLNPDIISEGNIKTISINQVDTSSDVLELPKGLIHVLDDNERYFHIVGNAGENQIDAFISPDTSLIFYSINGSRSYSFDALQQSSEEDAILPSKHDRIPIKLIITVDTSDEFPTQYRFMEKALKKWLIDEYWKLMDK